jgi:hypothetical protein
MGSPAKRSTDVVALAQSVSLARSWLDMILERDILAIAQPDSLAQAGLIITNTKIAKGQRDIILLLRRHTGSSWLDISYTRITL